MKRIFFFAFLAVHCFFLPVISFAQERDPKTNLPTDNPFTEIKPKVEVIADTVEFDRNAHKLVAKGNVVLRDEGVHLTCDYAEVATDSKKVFAKGHVVVFKKGLAVSHGDEIHYDFANDTGTYPDGRLVTIPWIIKGREMNQVRKGVIEVTDGSMSTCDYEEPHYDIRAKKVTVFEGNKLVAKNVIFYVLDKPIFWWPYLVFPLKDTGNLPLNLSAGYNSRMGAYLEGTRGFGLTENIWGKLHLDWRSLRGVGGGSDVYYDFRSAPNIKKLMGSGVIKGYVTQDKRAPNVGSENPFDEEENRVRGRATWVHRTDFDEYTNVIFRYNRLADEFFLQEFFEDESRSEQEPQSYVTFTKNSENYGFLTHVEKKANRFESLVERLPLVQFDWKTQPFFYRNLFYENQSSFANLTKQFGRATHNEDVTRYDSFHEWSLPVQMNQVKFTPFANIRGTEYSRNRESSNSDFRGVFSTGADLRTQAYKTYDVSMDKFGIEINRLRHVFEPSIQYRTVKSTVSDETLNEFDSIDRLDDADVLTFGIENRLQTKRVVGDRIQRVDIVSLNTFLSYELNPDGRSLGSQNFATYEDRKTKSNFTVMSQEIVLRPYSWLQTESRFDVDIENQTMRVFNQDLLIRKGPLRFLFGYRFIRDFANFEGGEQYVFETNYVINSLWSVAGYVRWQGGDLDEWQVMATRLMHDFIFDFGYNVRTSDLDDHNQELFFNFRFKAFPEIALRGGRRSGFSEPRIGHTVAGADQESGPPSINLAPGY